MTTIPIDNSVNGDLNAVITWRFDHASNLIGIIEMFKRFFSDAVSTPWTEFYKDLAIANSDDVKPYALAMWGKLLGIERPEIVYDEEPTTRVMSAGLYRKILIGRFRLANSNASVKSYIDYVKYVFGSCVSVEWTDHMDISFTWDKGGDLTEEEIEQKKAIEQFPNVVFAYPAGVKNDDWTAGPVLGFDGQQVDSPDPKGKGEFSIDNFSSTTFAWNRKAYT